MISRVSKQLIKIKIEFALLGLLSVLFILFSVLYNGDFRIGPDMIAGCILSVTNAFLGYVFVERAFRMNSNLFIMFSMAAMTLRFFLMIAVIAVFLITSTPNILEFVGSFMAFYTMFMVFEVLHINKKTDLLKLQRVSAR
jgi:hypothetical protein